MLKSVLRSVRIMSLIGLLFISADILAAFNTAGAQEAIDAFKTVLTQAPDFNEMLAALKAKIEATQKSAFVSLEPLATSLKKATDDFAAFSAEASNNLPAQKDVDALEAAYNAYVVGLESNALIAKLATLQAQSGEALATATSSVNELLQAFNSAQTFFVDSST